MIDHTPEMQKLEKAHIDSAFVFAEMVMTKGGQEGLPALANMTFMDVVNAADRLMAEGAEDPGLMRHTMESLLFLLRDSEQRSSRDGLTKIFNRNYMNEVLEMHIERVHRQQAKGGALVYIDLDAFKPINDVYGHAAGDAALIKAASTLHDEVRKIDVAARMGGDEFAVFLADADEQQAQYMTQRLRTIFSKLSFEWQGKELPIRASIGMTTIQEGQSLEEIYAAGDAAMYDVKKGKSSSRQTIVLPATQVYPGLGPTPA